MYGPLDDPKAVILALAEFDKLGRDAFLKKYAFARSKRYFVLHNGKRYDSKAILGAAYGFQHGKPLTPYDFNGGKYTVQPKLKSLGFLVVNVEAIDSSALPNEASEKDLWEGATETIEVNRYERNVEARKRCIEAHGTSCAICKFDFGAKYGEEFAGFIHVHHMSALAKGNGTRHTVDPKKDLIPVCPNCHAVIHFGGKLRSPELVKALLSAAGG